MRYGILSAGLASIIFAAGVAASEPIAPVSTAQPMLLTASCTTCNGAVTLHLRTVKIEPATEEMIVKIPVQEVSIVNGRVVERTRMVEERRQITVLRPAPGMVIDVPVDGENVMITDLKGKPLTPVAINIQLKKEKPVLVSVTGPVDPYYLQTTKLGTLIVQMPAQLLNPPTELHVPRMVDPNEPPIAPVRPK